VRGAFLILKKEFLELSKDRKTLFFTIFLPLLLYPILFSILGKMGQVDKSNRQGRPSRVYLVDSAQVLEPALRQDPKLFNLVPRPDGDLGQAIRDQKLEAALEVDAQAREKLARQETLELNVTLDPSEAASNLALTRLKEVFKRQDTAWVQARLETLGASRQLAVPTRLTTREAGDLGRTAAKILGSVVPFLMMIMMLTGSMQQGIYATAGERERGTLQTLLATSLPRVQIILGKLLYIFSIGLISSVLNLLSVSFSLTRLITAEAGPAQGPAHSMAGLSALTDPTTVLLAFLLLLPLGLLFANVILLAGVQAKTSQEAGTSIMPFMIVVMVLGYVTIAPGAEKMAFLPYIPIVNVSIAIRKMIGQQFQLVEYVVAFLMTVGLAGALTWLSVVLLNRDSAIFKG
jgi:sodium transport system permease protein